VDLATSVVILVILVLAGGAGAYVSRAIVRPLPALGPGGEPNAALPEGARTETALAEVGSLRTELDRLRAEARATAAEVDAGLGRLRERRDAVLAEVEDLRGKVRDELDRAEQARRAAEAAAELERTRERERAAAPGDGGADVVLAGVRAERAETLAELYRRLAKVEMALAALTAPILLPGEPYEIPDEFPPEALRWENWKEVGESAYAVGDWFNGRRLHLEPETAEAIAACLTVLRIALTQQVYPNLKPLPTPEDADALRGGLGEIAGELAAVRGRLEGDYRALAGTVERPANGG
jgi:hypothetical protein